MGKKPAAKSTSASKAKKKLAKKSPAKKKAKPKKAKVSSSTKVKAKVSKEKNAPAHHRGSLISIEQRLFFLDRLAVLERKDH